MIDNIYNHVIIDSLAWLIYLISHFSAAGCVRCQSPIYEFQCFFVSFARYAH